MKPGHRLRSFLLGPAYISSFATYKRALLTARLSLISISVAILYTIVDTVQGGGKRFIPFYIAIIIISLITLYLNRRGKFTMAIVLFLTTLNLLTAYFTMLGSQQNMNFLFFVTTGLSAFAFFGYKEKTIAILFVIMSVTGFLFSYVDPFDLGRSEPHIYVVINFLTVIFSSTLILYFTTNLNYHTEKLVSERNVQLLKANAELDRFVYSTSHDLKAPLSSIRGLIDIAQRTHDPVEIRHCLDLMKDRICNLDDFIREITDYARNARLDVDRSSFLFDTLLKEVIDSLKFAEGAEPIRLIKDYQPGVQLYTDRKRLSVILHNLISNAIKYHDDEKEDQFLKITIVPGHPTVSITIEDNGIGIAAEHQSKVFDMFYRASEKSQGSGLGLYIVQETLSKLGGYISFTSTLRKGSSFTVHLPQ